MTESLESILAHLPPAELAEARRILYGRELPALPVAAQAAALAEEHGFEIQGRAERRERERERERERNRKR